MRQRLFWYPAITVTVTVLSLMLSPTTWAAPDGAALADRLAKHAPQCGRFEQTRHLVDLETQLDSRGHFEQRDEGLVWETTSPVQERVVLSEDNDDLPAGFQVIAPVFSGLLGGHWQALEEHFTIELSGELDNWQATLTPNQSSVSERLNQLVVSGDQRVEKVALEFTNDDRLDLTLTAASCDDLDDGDSSP
ncbi:LolA family protein [Halomonas sp. HL-93]|uniref:LolA family protein n=1 Tax=Halomonas sp. HL-93 TaxID=1666906 RepID=UPI0006D97281|nr:LolA-related protein [Halomonas sp. HL-93]KPQ22671.1 MAG: hypothetical protein HLUCCO06_01100 [Halomonas sp. HL-93]SBR45397.1 hypothetical protein GA0071314_0221 [Halomonas sp. HL-93]